MGVFRRQQVVNDFCRMFDEMALRGNERGADALRQFRIINGIPEIVRRCGASGHDEFHIDPERLLTRAFLRLFSDDAIDEQSVKRKSHSKIG